MSAHTIYPKTKANGAFVGVVDLVKENISLREIFVDSMVVARERMRDSN